TAASKEIARSSDDHCDKRVRGRLQDHRNQGSGVWLGGAQPRHRRQRDGGPALHRRWRDHRVHADVGRSAPPRHRPHGAERAGDGRQRGGDDALRFVGDRPDHERDRGVWHGGGDREGLTRMLAVALYVVGAILLLIAAVTLLVGGAFALFLPQLIIGGLFLIIALAIERWRYKPIRDGRPDPHWTDTG